jgi:hypothetical protein
VSRLSPAAIGCAALLWATPQAGYAQQPATIDQAAARESSAFWLAIGGGLAALRGDCQTCEADYPYRRGPGVLVNTGYRPNSRVNVGAEVFWMPVDTGAQRVNTTHLDAIAQFRPWASHSFFVKGGAGVAVVRNWVDAIGPEAIRSKAPSILVGGGWAFHPSDRFGVQLYGAVHAVALGDFQTPTGNVQDVIGNFWSIGAALILW